MASKKQLNYELIPSGKVCSLCDEFKPYSHFGVRRALKDGFRSECKKCDKERRQTTYRDVYVASYTRLNRERGHIPLEEYRAMRKANRIPKSSRVARRRAQKKLAESFWADKQYMADLYRNAKEASKIFGVTFEVDHIVPLQNDVVCGLHNQFNLQILTAEQNRRKSNKFEAA